MKQESRENITEGSDEGFLSRWSRLKQDTREETAESADEERSQLAEQAAVDAAALEDDEVSLQGDEVSQLTDEDMPPLESLHEDSDYSGFMSPKVSDGLRRLALRKLFHSSSFNVLDGLNDYDEDFTSFAKLGDIVTCDMKFQAEQEEIKKAREALQAGSEAGDETSAETSAEAGANEEQDAQAADETGVEPSVADEQTLVDADAKSDSHIADSHDNVIDHEVEDDFDNEVENFLDEETDEKETAG